MLYLVSFNEQKYTRRLESFQAETLQYVIEFDASLTGAGVLWYQRLEDGSEVSIGGAAVDLRGFAFGTDSSFQNTAEFIGCILGLVGLVTLGVRNVDVEVRGDSIAALTWAETERPRGHVVTNASMVFTLLCICFGLDVKKGVHIPGEENWRCDRLSRMAEVKGGVAHVLQEIGRDGTTIVDLQSDMNVNVLLQGCDPRRDVRGEVSFFEFWEGIREALRRIGASVDRKENDSAETNLPNQSPFCIASL